VAFLASGLLLLVGPYVVLKGGLGTKPGIARVLGLAPRSEPLALERERPLGPDQTTLEIYRASTIRMLKVFRASVTPPMFSLALLGIVLAGFLTERRRACLFLGIVLAASAVALVRLHATGGYCTVRHGLVPGIILTLSAAFGLSWLVSRVAIVGQWLGLTHERLQPGPVVWAVLLAFLVVLPNIGVLGPLNSGPFSIYHTTGNWIAQHATAPEEVLDLTDWSLYFSSRPGYLFANVYEASVHPNIRWIVVRKPHVDGHWYYSQIIRDLIGDREPVALLPHSGSRGQVQVRIYDRWSSATRTADSTPVRSGEADTRRR
jgi:hypothetical protein